MNLTTHLGVSVHAGRVEPLQADGFYHTMEATGQGFDAGSCRGKDAAEQIPLHVLERVVAIPYSLDDGTLRIAVADPGNLHGIDELRLATRYPLDLGVASSEDILIELRRMARASEAFGTRAVLEEVDEELRITEEEEADDLEVEDGVSDAPLVRLVNSVTWL